MDRIVVGLDGSPTSEAALAWAITLASTLGEAPEHDPPLVHGVAVIRPLRAGALGLPPGVPEDVHQARRTEHIDQLRETVRRHSAGHGTAVELEAVDGDPAEELMVHAADADLLVVGRSELGRVSGLILGSTAQRCAAEATCPVVVIPHAPADRP